MQSEVKFNGVPEKVLEKVWRVWCRASSISTGLIHGNRAEVFPAFGSAERFSKICKNKSLRLLGTPPKLILSKS